MHKISSTVHFAKRRLALARDHEAHWARNTDVYVCDTGIVIKVELAGMQRENLELTVEGNNLRVSGQRPDGCRSAHCASSTGKAGRVRKLAISRSRAATRLPSSRNRNPRR